VAKDKSKKKKKDKSGSAGMMSGKTAKRLKTITKNPLIADIVAATLVGAAAALKDSKKAQRLAANAGDELSKLSKASAKSGSALWEMALKVGRESLEALVGDAAPAKAPARAKATRKPAARKAGAKPRATSAAAKRTSAPRRTTKRSK
jgi:hypothetical protein